MKKVVITAVAAVVIVPILALFFLSDATKIAVDPPVQVIGFETPVHIRMENPHGVRSVSVTVEQDGKPYTVTSAEAPSRRLFFARNTPPEDVTMNAGKKSAPALHDGKATLIVSAVSNDFRGKADSKSMEVNVILEAPRVVADGVQHYINQGGSEMAVFTPSGSWTQAGVKVGNEYTFRSFPLPNHPSQFFSLFAFSWDLPVTTPVYVFASNPSGAEAKTTFWYKVFPKKFRASTIKLESMNIDRIVNQIDTEHKIQGDLVQRFVYINREMRKVNNKTLVDLSLQTEPKFLWTGAFLPMVDSTVESRFADDRTYTWQGKKVDQETHLGFDLAKLAHSPIPASNDGKVIWAKDLGIYGNCIVIDHGYGLQSLYGHLSEFLVKPGDVVKKGQVIGKTGSTGLAGGDHLHFSMLLDGVEINPVEWWDPHWVKDRILSKMGTELASAGESAPVTPAHHPPAATHARKHHR